MSRPALGCAHNISRVRARRIGSKLSAAVRTVRSAVGFCDVSTLGKIELHGPDAGAFLDRLYINTFSNLAVGRARYGLMLREDGIAFDDGEFNPEVRCIAVPVMDFTGNVIGALGISGPIWRLSNHALQGHARNVRAAANRLSVEFGARDVAKSS